MSSAIKFAAIAVAAAIAAAPAARADDAKATDFLKLQQDFSASSDAQAGGDAGAPSPTVPPADVKVAKPAKTQKKPAAKAEHKPAAAPVLFQPAQAAVQPAADQLAAEAGDAEASGDVESQDLLSQVSKLQNKRIVLQQELDIKKMQAEIDKLDGVQDARIQAAQQQVQQAAKPAEPEDDTSTLPQVDAIVGALGQRKAELSMPGGGSMAGRVGDMLPGGWKVSKIEGQAVTVKSARTGTDYVLASSGGSGQAVRATKKKTKSDDKQDAKAEAPKAAAAAAADDGGSDDAAPILLAPANQ